MDTAFVVMLVVLVVVHAAVCGLWAWALFRVALVLEREAMRAEMEAERERAGELRLAGIDDTDLEDTAATAAASNRDYL
jgi:hypothetical protein